MRGRKRHAGRWGDVLGNIIAVLDRLASLGGVLDGVAQLPSQGFDESQVPKTVEPLARGLRSEDCSARPEGGSGRFETTGPQFHDSAARQCLHSKFRMPGVHFVGQPFEQGFRSPGRGGGFLKIPGTTGQRQPDQRRGEPGRDFVIGRKIRKDRLGCGERGEACLPYRIR